MNDPLVIFDRMREPTTALHNMLAGTPVFLLGGGPSTKQLDLNQLHQRGLWSMAVNNMAGHFRSNAFVCSDPPSKFHDGIWRDPGIMKFVPLPKLCSGGRGHLRTKVNGKIDMLMRDNKILTTADMPNMWAFGRRPWWQYDDTFFTEPEATWGNGNAGLLRTGNPKVFCTMLLAIRLLYYLGARRIFLVGVDFFMTNEGYSFGQGRTSQAVGNNNAQYAVVNSGLCKMVERGVFKKFGLEIYNCCKNSGLRAFPYVEYDTAVRDTLKDFPSDPLVLDGWYEKGQKEEDKK